MPFDYFTDQASMLRRLVEQSQRTADSQPRFDEDEETDQRARDRWDELCDKADRFDSDFDG